MKDQTCIHMNIDMNDLDKHSGKVLLCLVEAQSARSGVGTPQRRSFCPKGLAFESSTRAALLEPRTARVLLFL